LYSNSGVCRINLSSFYFDASGGYWLSDTLRITSGIRKWFGAKSTWGGVYEVGITQDTTVNFGATFMFGND
jgi:hypothetical protein